MSTSSWSPSSVNIVTLVRHWSSLRHCGVSSFSLDCSHSSPATFDWGSSVKQDISKIQTIVLSTKKTSKTSRLLDFFKFAEKNQERWCNIGLSENGVYPQSWKIGKLGKRMIHRWIYDIPIFSTHRLTSTQVLRQSAFFDQPGNLHAQWDRPWVIVPGDAKNIVLASVFFMFGGWWGNVKNEWMNMNGNTW